MENKLHILNLLAEEEEEEEEEGAVPMEVLLRMNVYKWELYAMTGVKRRLKTVKDSLFTPLWELVSACFL